MYQQPLTATSRFRVSKRTALIIILAVFFTASIIINYTVIYSQRTVVAVYTDPLPDPPHPTLKSLIMVPGHAIYHGPMTDADLNNDEGWTLEEFQKGGQIKVFIDHIKTGLQQLEQDNQALLVMSG